MKIFVDQSESRKGTRLQKAVVKNSQTVIGLERMTGADILLSIKDDLGLPGRVTDCLPHKIAIKKHCETGLLIQRKSGSDLLSSVSKLDEIMVRMSEWTPAPWLLVVGVYTCGRYDKVKLDGTQTGFPYFAMLGALDFWQLRGGRVTILNCDGLTERWLQNMGARLCKVQEEGTKILMPKKQQIIGKIDPSRTPILHTMSSFPGVGPHAAKEMADEFDSLADTLVWFGDSHREGKLKGVGPGMIKAVRQWLGLKQKECLRKE